MRYYIINTFCDALNSKPREPGFIEANVFGKNFYSHGVLIHQGVYKLSLVDCAGQSGQIKSWLTCGNGLVSHQGNWDELLLTGSLARVPLPSLFFLLMTTNLICHAHLHRLIRWSGGLNCWQQIQRSTLRKYNQKIQRWGLCVIEWFSIERCKLNQNENGLLTD